jgi:hypothetical protein
VGVFGDRGDSKIHISKIREKCRYFVEKTIDLVVEYHIFDLLF